MNILVFSHSGALSGAELALADLTSELVAFGHQVTVVVPEDGALRLRLTEYGVVTKVLPLSLWASHVQPRGKQRLKELWNLRSRVRQAQQLIRSVDPDLVCTNSIVPLSGAIAAKLTRTPHVWFIHELLYRSDPLATRIPRSLVSRVTALLSNAIIVPSACVAKEYPAQKTRIRPPVCRRSSELGEISRSGGELVLVVMGYRVRVKRCQDALRGLADLRRRGVVGKLYLIGGSDPTYGEELSALAEALDIDQQVRWLEFSSDPWALVPSGALLLSCSVSESFGRVVVEGMRAGHPVLAARSAGSAELISDGVTGLLYEPTNILSLVDQVMRLEEETGLREGLVDRAQRWVTEHLEPTQCAKAIEEVLIAATAGS